MRRRRRRDARRSHLLEHAYRGVGVARLRMRVAQRVERDGVRLQPRENHRIEPALCSRAVAADGVGVHDGRVGDAVGSEAGLPRGGA